MVSFTQGHGLETREEQMGPWGKAAVAPPGGRPPPGCRVGRRAGGRARLGGLERPAHRRPRAWRLSVLEQGKAHSGGSQGKPRRGSVRTSPSPGGPALLQLPSAATSLPLFPATWASILSLLRNCHPSQGLSRASGSQREAHPVSRLHPQLRCASGWRPSLGSGRGGKAGAPGRPHSPRGLRAAVGGVRSAMTPL